MEEKKEIKSTKYNNLWKVMEGVTPGVAEKIHLEVKHLEEESYKQGLDKGIKIGIEQMGYWIQDWFAESKREPMMEDIDEAREEIIKFLEDKDE